MTPHKRCLALDVGDRTCGVAASDELGFTAQPITTFRFTGEHEWPKTFLELDNIVVDRKIIHVVSGLPVNMNGSEGPQAGKVRKFIERWQNHLRKNKSEVFEQLEWHFWDERLSTAGAERNLIEADVSRAKRKKVIDTMAAVFILQGFMAQQESL